MSTTPIRQVNQRGLDSVKFVLTPQQVDTFNSQLVRAVLTANIPFTFVENPHLVKAMTSIGIRTVTRKQLADNWVPFSSTFIAWHRTCQSIDNYVCSRERKADTLKGV